MELAPLAVAAPLLGAVTLTAVATRASRPFAEVVALGATLTAVGLCVALLARVGSGLETYWFGGWEPRDGVAVGVSFAVDSFAAGLALLVAVLMVAALILMWRYRDTDAPHFQVLMMLFLAGMIGFCLTGDLFNMFVFFELMSVAAFALAGFKVEEEEAVEGSLNFAVTNTIGSFLILTGIALVYARTGALNLGQIGDSLAGGPADGLVIVAFALLASGFLVKAAVVPFHFWLADAYAVAPTPVCLLFAGAMSELGIYAVARIWFDSFAAGLGSHEEALRTVLIVAGSATALVGAAMCFAQDHLKRMLAFATIAYVGVFLIGLGVLSPEGVAGAAVYVVADGFGKAGLFAAVGIVQHRRRRVSELRLLGRGRDLPFTALLVLTGALSFAALPPFGTFLGKSLLEDGLLKAGYGGVIAVLILTSVLTSAAVLRAGGRVFLGWGAGEGGVPSPVDEPRPEEEGAPNRTPAVMFVPALALALGAFSFGLIPGLAESVQHGAERFMDGSGYRDAVLGGGAPTPTAPPPSYSAAGHSYLYAAVTAVGAVALAGFALFGHRVHRRMADSLDRIGGQVVAPLRALHSGHIGDYVAWLAMGVALLGGGFAVALQ